MNDEENGKLGGSLSASGRFARMESALERIEDKLDGKADTTQVTHLSQQIWELDRDTAARFSDLERSPLGREVQKVRAMTEDNRIWIVRATAILGAIVFVVNTIWPTVSQWLQGR